MHCLMFQGGKLSRMHLLHSVFTGFDTCKSLCKKKTNPICILILFVWFYTAFPCLQCVRKAAI